MKVQELAKIFSEVTNEEICECIKKLQINSEYYGPIETLVLSIILPEWLKDMMPGVSWWQEIDTESLINLEDIEKQYLRKIKIYDRALTKYTQILYSDNWISNKGKILYYSIDQDAIDVPNNEEDTILNIKNFIDYIYFGSWNYTKFLILSIDLTWLPKLSRPTKYNRDL